MNYSISDLSVKLSQQAEDVCRLLLPGGKEKMGQWEVGSTDGSPGVSCRVRISGQYVGKWRDWANDVERGDLIDLWQAVRGCGRVETLRQVKDYLGIHETTSQIGKKKWASPEESEKIKAVSQKGKVILYLNGRGIEAATVNRFKILGDGENIIYPSYSIEGELLNRCYVKLDRVNGKKVVKQDKGCPPALWGWQGLDESAFKDRKILICEGQIDCMTWTQWGVPALSVSNGSAMGWIDYEWENLEMFSEIFLSFDSDDAGADNLRKAMNRLGLHRCRVVRLPFKDANDALAQGWTKEQALEVIENAEFPKHEGLVSASKFRSETVEEFYPNPNKPAGFKPVMLQRFDGGIEFLPGDVTVWSGHSAHGKTTLLSWLMAMVIQAGMRSMLASLEMKPSRLLSRMLKSITNKPVLTPIEIDGCFEDIDGKLFFADKIGYINKKELLDTMLFAFSRYGVEHFVIDSLMRVSGLEEDYPAQGDFLNELQAFAKTSGSHVHLVAHPRKTLDEAIPNKLDVKGSSLIMNNCDNLLVVHKNSAKEKIRRDRQLTDEENRTMFDAQIVSEKQRDKGWHGRILLKFCPATFSFSKFLEF